MSHVFLRTVSQSQSPSLSDRLEACAWNTGNFFFEEALARQTCGLQHVFSLEDLPQRIDLLMMSMANFISPAADLSHILDALLRRDVRQIVMVGAGAQADVYAQKISLQPSTLAFLHYIAERSQTIGVRGHYTAEVLDGLGIKNVHVIGCPSAFWHGENFQPIHHDKNTIPARLAIHCTPHGHFRDCISSLLAHGISHDAIFVVQAARWIMQLSAEAGISSDEVDAELSYYAFPHCAPSSLRRWLSSNSTIFFDVESWISSMSRIDFAYGSRFHGNMAAILAGTPALNMVFDSRTRELCEFLNLPFIFLEDFHAGLTPSALLSAANFSLFNATYPAKLRNYASFLEQNGIEHRLGDAQRLAGAAADESYSERVARRSLATLALDICHHDRVRIDMSLLGREFANRRSPGRGLAERLAAERGDMMPMSALHRKCAQH